MRHSNRAYTKTSLAFKYMTQSNVHVWINRTCTCTEHIQHIMAAKIQKCVCVFVCMCMQWESERVKNIALVCVVACAQCSKYVLDFKTIDLC